MLKLTVLGNNGTYPAKNGACSSFLLEADEKKILIDMGNGSLAKLQNICELADIDIIIISHLHFDHFADLLPFKYAIETKKYFGAKIGKVKLFIPPVPQWVASEIVTNEVFSITYLQDGYTDIEDGVRLRFFRVNHSVDSFAVRVTYKDKSFAYSSDSGICEALAEAAKNVDLFLCESTLSSSMALLPGLHMTACDAGAVAKEAKVKKLLLTHLFDPDLDKEYLADARLNFGKVEVSKILKSYEV